jgi:hypothetical protein
MRKPATPSARAGQTAKTFKEAKKMKLEFELVEDSFDETTHIRTMTEQACTPSKDWLIRTTVYTPHHISISTVTMPGDEKRKDKGGFEPIP